MAIEHLVMLSADLDDNAILRVPQNTLVALYAFAYCEVEGVGVTFVKRDTDGTLFALPRSAIRRLKCVEKGGPIPQQLLACKTPAVYLPHENTTTCIGGLAGVLRWALGQLGSQSRNGVCRALLGFRGGCLAACSESSLWTRFCELDIQGVVPKLRAGWGDAATLRLPEELLLLEAHMRQPVKTHNVRLKQQQVFKALRTEGGNLSAVKLADGKLPELEHRFVEGFDETLADVILFPSVHLILAELAAVTSRSALAGKLPLTMKWYDTVCAQAQTAVALDAVGLRRLEEVEQTKCLHIEEPQLPEDSLYSSHPGRTKPRIRHKSPAGILDSLKEARIVPDLKPNPAESALPLPWDQFPDEVHPVGGGLPTSRVARKCQQIENLVVLALRQSFDGCTVVDFCSGGGHVGIVLAYLLPDSRVVMIENKEESMQRARRRVQSLGLKNVTLYQCNMDYFQGDFDLGVSLHACGVATDVVLHKCMDRGAAFVSCPCCYGAMKSAAGISYPLSRTFRDTGISKDDYLLLCHYADRTERDTPTCQQGHYCMALVDQDRAMKAAECGYEVVVTRMVPHDCSPKGLVLVGKPRSKLP